MEPSSAPFHVDRNGVHVSFDKVPSWVWKQCGEPYFESAEVDSIQAILRIIDE